MVAFWRGSSTAQHLFGSTTSGMGHFIKKGREGIAHPAWPQASLSRYANDLRPVSRREWLSLLGHLCIYISACKHRVLPFGVLTSHEQENRAESLVNNASPALSVAEPLPSTF